ncbi:MAG: Ribose import ATP-binding protein RbsA [Planctomycetes bacterium]|nr:Ribose import ATP-binding protein RbsA [Planctomycetota bacterium]
MTELAATGVVKRFGAKAALDGVSFRVGGGEIVGLLGENGAGKSTLLKIVSGFRRPDAGTVSIDGRDVRLDGPRHASSLGIGLVHQHFLLIPELTVAENVVLGREPGPGLALDLRAAEDEVRACAARFGLEIDPRAKVGDLGVAAQQRVELAKVLVRGARILLLDEPTGLLPPSGVRDLFALLRRLAAEGCGIALVTHRLREVREVCGRAVVLRQGKLVGERDVRATADTEIARMMVGEDMDLAKRARGPVGGGSPLLEVEGLVVASARGKPVVDGVGFTLHAGEVVGLAGVAGSGQTELLEALAGVRPCVASRIALGGTDLRAMPVSARRRAGVGYVPEDRGRDGLVPELSVSENVVLPATRRWARAVSGWLDRGGIRRAGAEAVARHDVRPPDPDAAVGGLSGGNQQKVLLAREIRERPKVLLAGEPARGLDFKATDAVHAHLRAVATEGGAVLVSSTDLAELLHVCDRILVVFAGRIAGVVRPEATSEDELGLLITGAARGTGGAA